VTDHATLLVDYRRLREASRTLHNRLIKALPKDTLTACAKRLGLLSTGRGRQQQDVLLLDDEYELAVLMDYCLYHGRQDDGRTIIEQTLVEAPPASGSDELTLLQAMAEARFSLFIVETTVPGVGVTIRDLLRAESLFLVDLGFSETAPPGMVLTGNVISLPELSMTTGAMLPVHGVVLEDLVRQLPMRFATATIGQFRTLSSEAQSELAASVIRACLAGGAASYVEPKDVKTGLQPSFVQRPRSEVTRDHPRNAPCPCGSGKKYKRCCGRI